ncbi:MAG: aldehyde dehydrogenase family protein [Bacteroidales bacterium]|nr:aldehyde dehydrogenase family protein [Bacteroidales bacterium]
MPNIQEYANEMMDRANMAAAVFNQLGQEQTDKIVENVYKVGFNNRVRLAMMAHEETGMGVWQHKVLKNVIATQLLYEDIKDLKTVGVIDSDEITGITSIAQPLGPILAVIPMTNPTSTTLFKVLISLKSRNPVIISSHRKAINSCKETVRICYEAALEAGAPEDCIQIVEEHSRELTHALMAHPKLALILATGGTGLVKSAYSSGNPAVGVGPGNVPVFIDKSADIPFAISSIISSKTFDNGTICASEQAIVVEKEVAENVRNEFINQNCYFLNEEEIKNVTKVCITEETGNMNADIVGQSVNVIAKKAGIIIPEETKIIIAPLKGIGKNYPLSTEVLAPILAFYVAETYEDAIKQCIDLNYLGGIGHTASIYANDEQRIKEYSEIMNAGRIVVNTPSSQGAVGGLFNSLNISFTLGCGSGGKNITTENISAKHLINIKKVPAKRENRNWKEFDVNKFLDEGLNIDDISKDYYKNQ